MVLPPVAVQLLAEVWHSAHSAAQGWHRKSMLASMNWPSGQVVAQVSAPISL